jgi:hypothetical protein
MKHSAANGESHSLAALTRSPEYGARLIEILPAIGDAPTTEVGRGPVPSQATTQLGADAGVFMSYLRDDATRASYRSLLACDPVWGSEYAGGLARHDPWLRHATHETEPVRSSELELVSADEEAFAQASAELGFASAVIAPAPTCVGQSRIGVLCLGSQHAGLLRRRRVRKGARARTCAGDGTAPLDAAGHPQGAAGQVAPDRRRHRTAQA